LDVKDFLGSGLKFPLHVDPTTGKIAMTSGEDDIMEAIGIIIATNRGERVMRPDFGSTASDYLFAPTGFSIRESIAHDIRDQLILQEPRIVDVRVTCSGHDGVTGSMSVDVEYTVRSTNNRYNKVYPFYLEQDENSIIGDI
jgi:phage baseplate assembly protein W